MFVYNCKNNELLYSILIFFGLESVYGILMSSGYMVYITNNVSKVKCGYTFGFIGYYLLGYYLKNVEIKKNVRYAVYGLGLLGAFFTVFLVMYDCISSQTLNERYWSYTTPMMFLYSVAVFVMAKNVFSKKEG